jgi:hypothetical protein
VRCERRAPRPRSLREQLRFARPLQNEPHAALLNFAHSHGPVVQFGYGRYRYVLVFGVEANEYVLQTNSTNFRWTEAFRPLVAMDGETALVSATTTSGATPPCCPPSIGAESRRISTS